MKTSTEKDAFLVDSIKKATRIKNVKLLKTVELKDHATLAIVKIANETTAFVVYYDNTVFGLDDWQSSYPKNAEEVAEYDSWMLYSREGNQKAVLFDELPRQLVEHVEYE